MNAQRIRKSAHSTKRSQWRTFRRPSSVVRPRLALFFALTAFLLPLTSARAGWSFDTGLSPEATRDLLATADSPAIPTGSWLRLRDMERSAVSDDSGAEVPPWTTVKPAVSVADRRAALAALRARGYRLVAFVRWPADSWKNGVRPNQPLRRLPIDLREAYERSRQLAATYGDLIDYWEIENEPDISFVEENPETYAAFLKACYLGFKKAAPDDRGQTTENGLIPAITQKTPPSAIGRPTSELRHPSSGVLNAAFALPPGPYFDAWVANDGLRYTDGFNYHYYGYAEDFTGVYQQFEQAVVSAPVATTESEAVFQTRFYPFRTDWQVNKLADFSADKAATATNRALLQSRPLAVGEPALQEQGRWLVSAGTTVKETAEGWEFTVTGPAPGPLRPAMAELPLREGWSAPADASLAFEYRVADATLEKGKEESGKNFDSPRSAISRPPSAIIYPPSDIRHPSSAAHSRELPIFLTEYGYGLLGKDARQTPAGREAQRAWFAAVQPQIAALKIEGPMAFLLRPYLEANMNEFGLLMAAPDIVSPSSAVTQPSSLGAYAVSPALVELFAAGASPASRSWTIVTSPPAFVIMDFVAGAGLQMSKSHRGYAMQADTGNAHLGIYHFGAEPVSGELALEGSAWAFAGGGQTTQLTIASGERREIPLVIRAPADRFVAQVAIARFRVRENASAVVSAIPPSVPNSQPSELKAPLKSQASGLSPKTPAEAGVSFEVYLRAANGNLYQTWPRLEARESWQWYVESLANFTPAFFGRAHLPRALAENKPAALVFFFRPEHYPATYLMRHAQVVEYAREKKPES